jgi:DNA-binding PadR family transcriptional regulator
MKDSHSFSVAVAVEVGVNEAILLQHLVFLQKSNCPPDGDFSKVWVRRSAKSLQITYPYFSQKELIGALGRLEKSGNIESQINNESAYDRAKSYRTTEQGLVLLGEIAFDKRANDIAQKGKSRFDKRANQDLTKGQMSSKEDYTDIIHSVSTGVIAKNEFSPDTDDDAPEYRIEVFEPMRVETVRLGAEKGKTSNGARRDVLQPGGNAADQLAPNWNTPEKARAMSARLGDEFAEMLEKEYGVKVVTVPSSEPIPDTLGKPKKTRRMDEPQPFPETAEAFAHFSSPDKIAALWKRWLAYKKDQHRERYKTADSELTKLRWLWKQTNGDTDKAEQIIERSIGDLYKGLLPLTENKNGAKQTTSSRDNVARQLVEIYANKRRAAENQRGTLGATETGWQL